MGAFIILFTFLIVIGIMVGVYALFIWVCGKMASSKGLPDSYKWFGLLGVIGIIVVAVSTPSYPQYPQYPTYPQNPQNGYGQNPYQQQNTYFGNNPYQQQPQQPQQSVEQPITQQPVQQQQSNLNFCPNCGNPVDSYSITCTKCGKTLR